jgi:sugar/nucleoside kinase (ribokinase family)
MSRPRVVVVGDVMQDVVARVDGPLAIGSDTPARIEWTGGGQAANTAAWFAAAEQSLEVVLVGRVGDDPAGRAAAAGLRALGVDARLAIDESLPTGTCLVLVGPDGERTMLPDPGANVALAPGDLDSDLLRAGDHLHVAGYALVREGPRAGALAAVSSAKAAGASVSLDPSSAALLSEGLLRLVRGSVDLLLPNADEAAALSGVSDPEAAALALAVASPEVVVTLAEGGALWTDGAEVVRAPADPEVAVVDSTGAGDAFAAGFIAARLRGAAPEPALRSGATLAARAIAAPGARPRL